MEQLLDEYVQRAQALPSFNIQQVGDGGEVTPWFEVTSDVAKDLLIYEQGLGHQVQVISGEINKWHRLSAQAKRVWQVRERQYRIWREGMTLELLTPPADDGKWKKPTGAYVDSKVRTDPMYDMHWQRIELAEEAYNSTQGVVEGLRAKRDMLKSYVVKHRDDAAPKLMV